MVHEDDRGLMLPPRIAPYQAVIVPIAPHKAGVMDKAEVPQLVVWQYSCLPSRLR